ncbi:carbon-nitrogen hydrolase family protein [Solihabitans fulvus]|uniref:Carbon-nitrogen hydrolase family protein n=1 Tax=Solihabitans fulvus TaxID=1892852 RepID=A0A5B2WV49_9PSEU|nr:carbon-nitrogen hydrolase family protein [Solihabitans fulvus]KAA2254908.1 carbon-nitrogen hydrolase family protein [Solihabitans fulvus]
MRTPLTVAAVQLPCVPGDASANAATHAELIALAAEAGTEVVVFPELSLVGYELDLIASAPDRLVVDPDGDAMALVRKACAEHGVHAVVGATAPHGGGVAIASLVCDDRGELIATYAKQYLHGVETELFVPGSRPGLVEIHGWTLGLAICADVAHAEHAELTVAAGADVYVGSALYWAGAEQRLSDHAAARAADNGCWVVLSTHGGTTGGGLTTGGSGVWGPDGVPRVQASGGVPEIVTATLS